MAEIDIRPQVITSTDGPEGFPLPTPTPAPTPMPVPPFALHNLDSHGREKPIASVTITGHPVHNPGAEQLGSLHLGEVIRYKDGSVDVVGYFPQGKGLLNDGDPTYIENSIGAQTPEQYLNEAKQHYTLDVKPTPGQSLEQLVAQQAKDWAKFHANPEPPSYDFSGQLTHNSNSAMVGSLIAAGRPDVGNRLMQDLEPPAMMKALEAHGRDREAAAMQMALDRRLGGLPSAPGASNPLSPDRIRGGGTPDAPDVTRNMLPRQVGGAGIASGSEIIDSVLSLTGSLSEAIDRGVDRLMYPPAAPGTMNVVRTGPSGDAFERKNVPFEQSGRLLYADKNLVVQEIAAGRTFTYSTQDLIKSGPDAEKTLALLEAVGRERLSVDLKINGSGLDKAALMQSLQRDTQQRSR